MAVMVMTAGQDPGLVLVECVDCDEWFAASPSLATELAQIVAVLHVCELSRGAERDASRSLERAS